MEKAKQKQREARHMHLTYCQYHSDYSFASQC